MKKKACLSLFPYAIITLSLLLNACLPTNNTVVINPTSTPIVSNSPATENPAATSTPEEAPDSSAAPESRNFDVCGFFSAADAEPIVGTALIEVTAHSDIDDVTGGPMEYCNYKGDDVALVLSIVKSNALKDSAEWQGQILEMTGGMEATSLSPTSGLGEQATWMVLENAAGWNVAKYPYVFALVVGGNIGYSEDYKDDLSELAQRVVDGLP